MAVLAGLARAQSGSIRTEDATPDVIQSGSECLDGADAARFCLGQPRFQLGHGRGRSRRLQGSVAADQDREPPCKGGDQGRLLVLLNPTDGHGVRGRQGFGRAHQQPRELLG